MSVIPSTTPAAVAKVRVFEQIIAQQKQIEFVTQHLIHTGMYARTVMMPADGVIVGALIKPATILIVCGDVTVSTGEDSIRITGYNVIPAQAHRKQAFYAHTDTYLTMLFPTEAKNAEDAEIEFTDEYAMLASHRGENVTVITDDMA